ncbi:hypothetical protein [Streptosporangium sp. NPDC003464]
MRIGRAGRRGCVDRLPGKIGIGYDRAYAGLLRGACFAASRPPRGR